MKISGFTIVCNALKYQYPVVESIRSILPLCDEFVVNVGESEDDTLRLIESIQSPKIRVLKTTWDFSEGKTVLSRQTNAALKMCTGDWAFYLQTDEVIHEDDLPKLRDAMQRYLHDETTDALRFKWFHFYGSYYRYRVDRGWYQKQDRIIKNNGQIESFGDAYAFRRKDGAPLKVQKTGCFVYHYGWVQPQDVMQQRRINAQRIGFVELTDQERQEDTYTFGDLSRFPAYFGSHPTVMAQRVQEHDLSREDLTQIRRRYWWHPMKIMKARYKTIKRVKERIA